MYFILLFHKILFVLSQDGTASHDHFFLKYLTALSDLKNCFFMNFMTYSVFLWPLLQLVKKGNPLLYQSCNWSQWHQWCGVNLLLHTRMWRSQACNVDFVQCTIKSLYTWNPNFSIICFRTGYCKPTYLFLPFEKLCEDLYFPHIRVLLDPFSWINAKNIFDLKNLWWIQVVEKFPWCSQVCQKYTCINLQHNIHLWSKPGTVSCHEWQT